MPAENVLERALEGVSDGQPVEWDLLDSGARDEDERECLKWLRVLGEVSRLHRSTHEALDESDQMAATRSTGAPDAASRVAARTWGRYQLLEKVGEGSFGSVHRAWDPQLECELAVKILHQKASDERLKARLLGEGRALAKIRHPNVVRVLGIESHEDRVGLCMEFIRGRTLDDVLRTDGTLSGLETVLVGRDVCGALAAVHQAGFVHRDVKARNVLREQGGRIVLMDFGAGLEMSHDSDRRESPTGTPLYMAPEVLAGEPASPCSDVYSVGVLLYHLVTGEYPVHAATVDELRAAHRQGRRRLLSELRPDLPVPFVRVVARTLAADPRERFANAGALLDALRSVLRDEPAKGRTVPERLLLLLYAVGGALCLATALGAFCSVEFHYILRLSGFEKETPWDWLVWGVRSSLLPVFLVMSTWIVATLVTGATRLLVGRSSRAARLREAVRRRVGEWVRRYSFHDASGLSSFALLTSATTLTVAWWYFSPVILACIGGESISTAPRETLALLSPALQETYHNYYRETFTFVTLWAAGSWYAVLRLAAREGQTVSRATLVGGAAIIVLALATLDLPYRLFLHSEFEVAKWNTETCYIIGERTTDMLLFCPDLDPPRNRIVQKDAGTVKRLELRENIFTRFPAAGSKEAP